MADFFWLADAFPLIAVYWGAFAPGSVSARTRMRAKALGEEAAQSAATQHGTTVDKVLGAQSGSMVSRHDRKPTEPPPGTSDVRIHATTRIQARVRGRQQRARYRELRALRALLRRALPSASARRIGALTQMLGLYGIDLANLRAALGVGDGAMQLVWHALDGVPGIQIGEKLQIVTELARGQAGDDAARAEAAKAAPPAVEATDGMTGEGTEPVFRDGPGGEFCDRQTD